MAWARTDSRSRDPSIPAPSSESSQEMSLIRRRALRLAAFGLLAVAFASVRAEEKIAVGKTAEAKPADDLVSLDFNDVELGDVIKTIAKMTGRNFIYDDRVRGRVTIVSPSPVPVEQAYAVFESVLQVKGF